MKRGKRQQGFTLIEILVSIALLGIIMSFSAGILTAFQANSRSAQRLTVNQSIASWFEEASNRWSIKTKFGDLNALPDVQAIPNATWQLRACVVEQSTGNTNCGAYVESGKPLYADYTSITTQSLVQLELNYTPSIGAPISTILELTKR